jgi:hypothetical protein
LADESSNDTALVTLDEAIHVVPGHREIGAAELRWNNPEKD